MLTKSREISKVIAISGQYGNRIFTVEDQKTGKTRDLQEKYLKSCLKNGTYKKLKPKSKTKSTSTTPANPTPDPKNKAVNKPNKDFDNLPNKPSDVDEEDSTKDFVTRHSILNSA
ncbi:MAG: hypothetical protein HUJ56_07485 [Erysipelotrichaceae bacterium]|nr:hypothetical protein [Erysipelotrichaceae bacterium]